MIGWVKMGNKPTVTILADSLRGHGGEETVLKIFSDNLSDNFKIQLLIPLYKGSREWIDGFNNNITIKCNKYSCKIFKYIFVLRSLLLCHEDIIVCMTPKLTYLAYKIKKIFHKKYKIVSWQHFSLFRPTDKSSLADKKKWYGSADYYLAISSGIKKELISLGIESEKIFTIYNPIIPTDKIISKMDPENPHFLCIARIQFKHQKNLKELFDACRNLTGNWFLDMYGNDDTEGKTETKKCLDYVNKLGLSDHVIWHGWVNNISGRGYSA